MALRFFADHCVSNFIIKTLRDAGHEVLRLKDHIPTDSPDSVVISKAQELDAVLISLNGYFADIVMYPPEKYKGIIALQVRNHPEIIPQIMAKLADFISSHFNILCGDYIIRYSESPNAIRTSTLFSISP